MFNAAPTFIVKYCFVESERKIGHAMIQSIISQIKLNLFLIVRKEAINLRLVIRHNWLNFSNSCYKITIDNIDLLFPKSDNAFVRSAKPGGQINYIYSTLISLIISKMGIFSNI